MASINEVRLFIALDIPLINDDNAPIQFVNTQLLISQALPQFSPSRHLHCTIAFLGSVNESLTGSISQVIKSAIKEFAYTYKQGLNNGVSGLMILPGIFLFGKNAVVLKLIDGSDLLRLLTMMIRKHLVQASILFDETHEIDFHVTVGRIAHKVEEPTIRFLEQLTAPIGGRSQLHETFTALTVTFYKSLPTGEYEVLKRFKV